MSFQSTDLSTVKYQVLFTKRDLEAILEDRTQVVSKTVTDSGFASWKIGEFISQLMKNGIPKPTSWSAADAESIGRYDPKTQRITAINSDELDNLEVEYQVLSVSERKQANYDKDTVSALEKIAQKLPSHCRSPKPPRPKSGVQPKKPGPPKPIAGTKPKSDYRWDIS